ncbi:COG1470 family protein [Paenibacillus spongiae]|uniref:Alpha-galactosidase NEW3 domain-containing protein n=1 Tax=Paenibacillus spongiae TaxID=2909671 RepID=A0ABY5S4N0_9BACL|nr:hypothetical protein [Paenibacillus spongiae]UVI27525.1 hypothetical protein L1F29_18835 [Paenibacillus spongiae]
MTMNRTRRMRGLIGAIVFAMLCTSAPAVYSEASPEPVNAIGYEFNEDGNLEGWGEFHNGIEDLRVEDGALQLRATGEDPNWFAPASVGLQTSAEQKITFRMKATKGDSVAIYFDTDVSPGLAQFKRIVVPILPDGEYHEYSINPSLNSYWTGVVQTLRMDLEPSGSYPADVSVDYFRIGERVDFGYEFNGQADGWSATQDLTDLQAGSSSIAGAITGPNPAISSSPINEQADKLGEIKIRTRVGSGNADSMIIAFTTNESPDFSEEKQLVVPLTADGAYHEYAVSIWEHPSWNGQIDRLRLSLQGAAHGEGAEWEVDYIRFQSVALPSFDWNVDGNAQGWLLNDLSLIQVSDGVLRTKVSGGDPYFGNESLEGIIGERDKTLTVRMSATAGDYVSIFFATNTAPMYAEVQRIDFPIIADGNMHDYTIDTGDHPEWKGKIIKLRMDLEGGDRAQAEFSLDEVRFTSSPASANLTVKRSKPALQAGEEADITFDIRNTGGKAFFNPQAELTVTEGLEIVSPASIVPLEKLRPGGTASVTWRVKGIAESPASVSVKLSASGYDQSNSAALPVLKAAPAAQQDEQPKKANAFIEQASGNAVLENEHTRIVAPKSSFGYGQYQVYAWDESQGWKLMASVQPFAAAIVKLADNGAETVSFHPKQAAADTRGGTASLRFQGDVIDSSGRKWTYEFDFILNRDDQQVKTSQRVRADRDAELLNLIGPVLTVGEGSFGAAKDEALFPGLEWLVGDEVSSSKLDVHTPAHLRLVPHPYKITVPLMAVRQDEHIVSLSWDPKQKWDGVHDLPAAKFASPNWVENQNNHVMGLSALSVANGVKENEELAQTAYPLIANKTITLKADITTAEAESVSEAVSLYVKEEGLPNVPQVNSFAKQVDLGLDAYLRTYWDPVTKGWLHVNIESWGTNQYPSDMTSLMLLGMSDPSRKADVEAVISQSLSAVTDKNKLGVPDYHIAQSQASFYVGYMDEALAGLKNNMQGLINSQHSSGAWLYGSEDAYNPPLGSNGTPLLGQTALNAKLLLKYAAMTGNEQAKEAGLKGLSAVEAMGNVPRASQPWEVPLHTPDILASGHTVGAYIQAYKLTGDEAYIDKAIEWAKTGLPFVYTWGVEDRPVMEYATIPIFGASAYNNPWFAVPVQWNGLVYAYELLELVPYDKSGPWKKAADGILASAELQQASDSDEPWRGGYPDNWRLITNSRSDTVMLNPEEIVKTIFMQRYVEGKGPKPDVQSTVIPSCNNPKKQDCTNVYVTTLAKVKEHSASHSQQKVAFDLIYPAGETSYVLVVNREKPKSVSVNGSQLDLQADLNSAASGWKYSEDTGYLILKLKHAKQDKVKIQY